MMYLFPVKVQEINDRIDRKKIELELYKKIITETIGFMKQRIQETKQKQNIVTEINEIVGQEVQQALEQEQEFYESSDRDKLKTPPFVYVKRIERPGEAAYERQPKPAGSNKKRNTSKKRQESEDFRQHGINIQGVLSDDGRI